MRWKSVQAASRYRSKIPMEIRSSCSSRLDNALTGHVLASSDPGPSTVTGRTAMLGNVNVEPMLPVKDLKAAEKFYEGTLGLQKVHVEPDNAVTYRSGNTTLVVYRSEY